jgi:pimeloyl-ACP methyl ester carboxylesterase
MDQEGSPMQRREFMAAIGAAAAGAISQSSPIDAQPAGGVAHRTILANGIHLHFAEQGEGPLVLLCHGFPECWYSWRHQLPALSAAGFHAVAVDMRGYGQSDRPEAIEQYTLLHLVGDMVGLLDALGVGQAVIAGHDWGAPVAWHAALLRPDRFRAVIGLSVPFMSRSVVFFNPSAAPPTSVMPQRDDAIFYQIYFQAPGVAEAELERDVRQTFLKLLANPPSERPAIPWVPREGGWITRTPTAAGLPVWLTEGDIDFYAGEFKRTGFRGGLNWYRNIDRNWELLAPFAGAKVTVPALYMTGDRTAPQGGIDRVLADLANDVPRLRRAIVLRDCGHWAQQERPSQVNAAMIDFLREL